VPAQFVSPMRVVCKSPPASELGTVPVAISLNGVDFESTQAPQFEYRVAASVLQIAPGFGPVDGGTLVSVLGTGFLSAASVIDSVPVIHCRFDAVVVQGSVVSDTEAECYSPRSPLVNSLGGGGQGAVPFAVSFNGRDFEASALQYSYR